MLYNKVLIKAIKLGGVHASFVLSEPREFIEEG